ncbi:MAG: phosphoadenylyl-sulfate reductase [Deltaproteobacteria bacterium]|nr:phosphoadenylyl-sulfate reductase [Deltaproteobacteria bacterium]
MSAALDELSAARAELAGRSAPDILAWTWARFGARAVLASSFGAEDVALIDLASRVTPKLEVFTLDTGRLHPETYEVMQAIRERYGINLRVYAPERASVEKLESEQGLYSFRESLEQRKACCAIRKVEPLKRALAGREAWVTGLRREQSVTRAGVEVIEIDDSQNGIWKLNPLAAWTEADVWNHIRQNRVPYHALHDVGFSSIGCAPCTRAVKPYEDARAGRWWWEQPEHKECGLHARR